MAVEALHGTVQGEQGLFGKQVAAKGRVRPAVERRQHGGKQHRGRHGVAVEERQGISCRGIRAEVARRGGTAVDGCTPAPHPASGVGFEHGSGAIRRAVVHDDDFAARATLRQECVEQAADCRSPVVDGNDKREADRERRLGAGLAAFRGMGAGSIVPASGRQRGGWMAHVGSG